MANGAPDTSIIFLGSGPVAVASLQNLHENYAIELVVTKRRPPHHKDPAPVETYADAHGLKVIFADNKDELESQIMTVQPRSLCGVVIDYGVIISQQTIDYFNMGIINSHFSLLPEWRGADPITFALLSGQTATGVSLMRIDAGLDTGDILAEAPVTIEASETGESLTEKLIATSNALLNELLGDYIKGNLAVVPQPADRIATYSRKLQKSDAALQLSRPASVLEREIRAFGTWPKSKLRLGDIDVIITHATATEDNLPVGKVIINGSKTLLIGTRIGSLRIDELMPVGKQNMPAAAFINGYGSRILAK